MIYSHKCEKIIEHGKIFKRKLGVNFQQKVAENEAKNNFWTISGRGIDEFALLGPNEYLELEEDQRRLSNIANS